MKPKHQRLLFILIGLLMLGGAAALALNNFEDNIVFYYAPSDLRDKPPARGEFIRLGGFVEQGSVEHPAKGEVAFFVTDFEEAIKVHYKGALPALFREGQGVVAEGKMTDDENFSATRILAKHDENYMPPEVKRILKEGGHWKEKNQGYGVRNQENTPSRLPESTILKPDSQ